MMIQPYLRLWRMTRNVEKLNLIQQLHQTKNFLRSDFSHFNLRISREQLTSFPSYFNVSSFVYITTIHSNFKKIKRCLHIEGGDVRPSTEDNSRTTQPILTKISICITTDIGRYCKILEYQND